MNRAQRLATLTSTAVLALATISTLAASPALADSCVGGYKKTTKAGDSVTYSKCQDNYNRKWITGTIRVSNTTCRVRVGIAVTYSTDNGTRYASHRYTTTPPNQLKKSFTTPRYNSGTFTVGLSTIC